MTTPTTAARPDEARELVSGFHAGFEHAPQIVVAPLSAADVVSALAFAREQDLAVTVVGRGHGHVRAIRDGMAMTTTNLSGVAVDPVARTARVGAGTTWAEVLQATAPHAMAPIVGSDPSTGAVGYVLGGGLSPVGRTFGWAADHVRSFEVVTAAGEVLTASTSEHPDLYWALCGGGGGAVVVTAMTIDLVEVATVYGGGLYFGAADAGSVVRTFAAWSSTLPESFNTSFALLRMPDLEVVPRPLRGQYVVHVRVAATMAAAAAEQVLAPVRAAGTPLLDTLTDMPFAAIGSVHADPPGPSVSHTGGVLLRRFDVAAAEALLGVAGPGSSLPILGVELRVMGGALRRPGPVDSCVGGRDAAAHLFVVTPPVLDHGAEGAFVDAAGQVFATLAPWATGGTNSNFHGILNHRLDLGRPWASDVEERLAQVRRRYDPSGLIAPRVRDHG